ncbi:MAG TPA: type II secretion system protein [Candidatus Acidoferrum sp.]|nr:type II secretion system protein [Candidatus Acidoferrum sp.]
MQQRKNQAGYTFIELLLYISIVGTLLTGVTLFFGLAADDRIKNQSTLEVNQQGMAAMEYMTQTIRNATSITTPAAGGSGASLTLVVRTGALSPTVFDLTGTNLEVKEGAGAAVLLTSNDVQISGLTFKNLTRSGTFGIVQVSFTIARTNSGGRPEYSYQKSFVSSVALR